MSTNQTSEISFGSYLLGNAIDATKNIFLDTLAIGTQVSLPIITGAIKYTLSPLVRDIAHLEKDLHSMRNFFPQKIISLINPIIPITYKLVDTLNDYYHSTSTHDGHVAIGESIISSMMAVTYAHFAKSKPDLALPILAMAANVEIFFTGEHSCIQAIKNDVADVLDYFTG
jgi:hypothetical protein